MIDYAAIRTAARNLVLDSESVISDTFFGLIFNDVYNWYHSRTHDRVTNLTGAGMGLSVAASGYSMLTTRNTIQTLRTLYRESASGVVLGTPMRYVTREKLYWMRRRGTTNGVPKYWTAWREEGTSDWRVLVHPPADGTYHFSGSVVEDVTDLSADADLAMVAQGDTYVLARLCAWEMAYMLDRDEIDGYMDGLLAPLDDELKSAFEAEMRGDQPRSRAGSHVT